MFMGVRSTLKILNVVKNVMVEKRKKNKREIEVVEENTS